MNGCLIPTDGPTELSYGNSQQQDIKMKSHIVEFRAIGDARGWLTPLEAGIDVPFEIKRMYIIYGTQRGIDRGFHAHRDLEQVVVCVSGSCRFVVDDGRERADFILDKPNVGLYVGPMVWREMTNFSPDCVLVVLASKLYSQADYIRDYSEFRRLAAGETNGQ